MSLLVRWRGPGGNREVPPIELRAVSAATVEEEEGAWGKPGVPHGPEPKAQVGG
jgi:hypothetical protein